MEILLKTFLLSNYHQILPFWPQIAKHHVHIVSNEAPPRVRMLTHLHKTENQFSFALSQNSEEESDIVSRNVTLPIFSENLKKVNVFNET